MIGKTLGDFEIREEIGRGGMGQVYKARQISLDRDVAIKILPGNLSEVEEFRERFDLEAKVVASLIHENILQVYSKGITADGIHYFAMEYVDGEDLSDTIKRGGYLFRGGDNQHRRSGVPWTRGCVEEEYHPPRHQTGQHHAHQERDH